MSKVDPQRRASLKTFLGKPPRAIGIDPSDLVRWEDETPALPSIALPATLGVDLATWIGAHRARVRAAVERHGAVLFRGFDIEGNEGFAAVARAFGQPLLDYSEASTPRTEIGARVYTSTEYPASQTIPPHNEMSYARRWPELLWFCCLQPAVRGGATPLSRSDEVLARIDPAIVSEFERRGVMYVRNFGGVLDLPWQRAFGTDRQDEVTRYCAANGIDAEWQGDRLRTRQVQPAVVTHQPSGRRVWFNQAHLFHVSSLPTSVRDALLSTHAEDALPRNAYYGDGGAIEESTLEHVRAAYGACARSTPWERGDVLLVDNVLCTHGREPFEGDRRVIVAMTAADEGGN